MLLGGVYCEMVRTRPSCLDFLLGRQSSTVLLENYHSLLPTKFVRPLGIHRKVEAILVRCLPRLVSC
eukprot:scaffold6753_cov20-Prasinocladus_malaysianus.AAC.2